MQFSSTADVWQVSYIVSLSRITDGLSQTPWSKLRPLKLMAQAMLRFRINGATIL